MADDYSDGRDHVKQAGGRSSDFSWGTEAWRGARSQEHYYDSLKSGSQSNSSSSSGSAGGPSGDISVKGIFIGLAVVATIGGSGFILSKFSHQEQPAASPQPIIQDSYYSYNNPTLDDGKLFATQADGSKITFTASENCIDTGTDYKNNKTFQCRDLTNSSYRYVLHIAPILTTKPQSTEPDIYPNGETVDPSDYLDFNSSNVTDRILHESSPYQESAKCCFVVTASAADVVDSYDSKPPNVIETLHKGDKVWVLNSKAIDSSNINGFLADYPLLSIVVESPVSVGTTSQATQKYQIAYVRAKYVAPMSGKILPDIAGSETSTSLSESFSTSATASTSSDDATFPPKFIERQQYTRNDMWVGYATDNIPFFPYVVSASDSLEDVDKTTTDQVGPRALTIQQKSLVIFNWCSQRLCEVSLADPNNDSRFILGLIDAQNVPLVHQDVARSVKFGLYGKPISGNQSSLNNLTF